MTTTATDFDATRVAGSHGAPWFGTYALDFVTPQLNQVAALWEARRGSRTMPSRGDLTIRDLKHVLPHVTFMDIVRGSEGLRFRVRLMGSVLDQLVAPITGRFIDEVVPQHFATKWTEQWMPAIDGRRPRRAAGRVEYAERRWYVAESLYAPLAQDGDAPDILMVVAFYHALDKSDGAAKADLAGRLAAEINACSEAATR
ncbi:MAG: PAS domain-containing protein [Alphaproteobacteria bacterium]|nr:PAS domain-containing protein [Alphaproteobacteria bacterium]